jgi:hypothetical protein
MGSMWGLLVNVAIVLTVINGLIWVKARRAPAPVGDRDMFGTVATGFGGADFVSAALVVLVNIGTQLMATSFAGVGQARLHTGSPGPNWALLSVFQLTAVVVNSIVIAWRNDKFLDWKWSVLAAALIFVVPLLLGVIVYLLIGGQ